ncbi:hypothetical protein [Ruegeria marina]|uniref:Uncharacterized protein n=1 Tax=Ruegeria marina TaxID=639004 RepID=A0A1G6QBQ9_9RHOB|nr:hypothetical protein [Ruegeria marina]SDC89920.1 hypothetical protein SAMN04488239_10482 [Ruegeria marina]
MNRTALLLATATLIGLSVPADALTTRIGARVLDVDGVVFEVVPRGRQRTGDFWCAASEYARRALGAGWNDRIYIARGRGPSVTTGRKTAVQFTMSPQAAGITPLENDLTSIRVGLKVGDNMSVNQANGYCDPTPVWF